MYRVLFDDGESFKFELTKGYSSWLSVVQAERPQCSVGISVATSLPGRRSAH